LVVYRQMMSTVAMTANQPPAAPLPRVAVIGLGYVGLPLAHAFVRAGLEVIGIDTDPAKADALMARPPRPYLKHLGESVYSELATAASAGRFVATTDHSTLARAQAIIVCVPTPLDEHHKPDLSYVTRAGEAIAKHVRFGGDAPPLLVLESTSYPGTTRDDFLAPLRAARPELALGTDYFGAFSPEREDPGNKQFSTTQIPKLVGGLDAASTARAVALYGLAFTSVIPTSSAEVAEAAKLLENIFRSVNIALVNELKVVFEAMGIDIWEVIAAAKTKPFGFMPFYPGPGLGGHCIPIDPFYLSWKAEQIGVASRFIELAGVVNTRMPQMVVGKVLGALGARRIATHEARVLIIGMAYKPDIDDVRESPSFVLIQSLQDAGVSVDYHDPLVARTHAGRKHDLGMASVVLDAESVASYHAVVIATAHSSIDYGLLAQHARVIIDTRNAIGSRGLDVAMGERLIRA